MTTTITTVASGQKAHIEGVSRHGQLFIFGSVEAYAKQYAQNPGEAVAKAIRAGHAIAWASPESAVIVDRKTNPGYYERMHKERAEAVQLSIGSFVQIEGRVYEIRPDWNNNVKLTQVSNPA